MSDREGAAVVIARYRSLLSLCCSISHAPLPTPKYLYFGAVIISNPQCGYYRDDMSMKWARAPFLSQFPNLNVGIGATTGQRTPKHKTGVSSLHNEVLRPEQNTMPIGRARRILSSLYISNDINLRLAD